MTMGAKGRTAEIAGAGLAGLALATRLAQLGWRVRLHERESDLRMAGAGIWLWENGLKVLSLLGAFEQATSHARIIREWRVADEHGNILMTRTTSNSDRFSLPPREDLYEALIDRAVDSGVEILTSSPAAAVRPEGVMVLENGKEREADLIAVADGAYSRLRECIRSEVQMDLCIEGSIRMMIDHQSTDPTEVVTEYWNGRLRLGYNPCTRGQNYIFLCAPLANTRACKIPYYKKLGNEHSARHAYNIGLTNFEHKQGLNTKYVEKVNGEREHYRG